MNKRLDKIEPCESKIVPRKWTECVAFKWIFHGLMFFLFFFFFKTDVSIRRNRATVTHTHTHSPRYLWIFSRCFEHIIFIYNLAIHRWRVRQSRGVTSVQSFPHSLPPSLEKRCDYKTEARYWNEKKKGRRGRKKEKNILDAISRNNEERFLTRKITR